MTATHQLSKADLRKLALARRSALTPGDHRALSEIAAGHMAGLIRPNDTVALFLPIRGEIDTGPVFPTVHRKGGRILLPAIVGGEINFRFYEDGDRLADGRFGTRQPAETAEVGTPDLIVAPLAAFDDKGNRIGYGGGYYDGATARLDRTGHRFRYCGFAFSCQRVDMIPSEPHDRRLDAVVSEDGVTWFQEPA